MKTTILPKTLRNNFASCSSGQSRRDGRTVYYYPTKGHAINDFDAVLQTYGYAFDRDELIGRFNGDNGSEVLTIRDEFGAEVAYACLSWYRLPSGNYEFTGYLA